MATTSPDNLRTPDAGDQYALVQDLGRLADDVQDAITDVRGAVTSQNRQFRGLAAAKASVTGMVLGDTYQETDGSKWIWKYDGTGWVYAPGQLIFDHVHSSNILTLGAGTFFTTATTLPANQKVKVVLERLPVFGTAEASIGWQFRVRTDGSDVGAATGTFVSAVRGIVPGGSLVTTIPGFTHRMTMPSSEQKLSAGVFFDALAGGAGGSYGPDGIYIRAYSE